MTAAMGSSGPESYANLRPLDDAATLRGSPSHESGTYDLYKDAAEALTANVWNIFMIKRMLGNQKLLMWSIVNNSGGSSNIETAYMRIV